MRNRLLLCALSGVIFFSGCAQLPIKNVPREETRALLDDFQSHLAGKYGSLKFGGNSSSMVLRCPVWA